MLIKRRIERIYDEQINDLIGGKTGELWVVNDSCLNIFFEYLLINMGSLKSQKLQRFYLCN